MLLKFIINGRLPGYNELKGRSWQASYRLKEQAKRDVQIYAMRGKVRPIKGKAMVKIAYYEPNARRDPDNVQSGANKIILDALQDLGVLQGDGRKYVTLISLPVEVDKNNPRIEVIIEEMED